VTSSHPGPPSYDEVDPFDLPDWLGVEQVTWAAVTSLRSAHRVQGSLTAEGHDALDCDLLAVDEAYPAPVAADALRVRVHQLWQHGEVLLLSDAGRLMMALPGSRVDAESALEAVGRLARAVGATGSYGVRLRVGTDR
jgi:hypothetical protein